MRFDTRPRARLVIDGHIIDPAGRARILWVVFFLQGPERQDKIAAGAVVKVAVQARAIVLRGQRRPIGVEVAKEYQLIGALDKSRSVLSGEARRNIAASPKAFGLAAYGAVRAGGYPIMARAR